MIANTLLDLIGKLHGLIMASYQTAFTSGKRSLRFADGSEYFKPAAFAFFPHG